MNLLDQIVAARRLSIARSRADRARSRADRAESQDDRSRSRAGCAENEGDRARSGAVGAGSDVDRARGQADRARSADRDGLGPSAAVPMPVRSLRAALSKPGRRVIAEIKRRSPSAGVIRHPLDPREIARIYEHAGAAAVSVLTEPEFFDGSDSDLVEARSEISLPVLRKDFILDREQVLESRALGADAVLLLASVLSAAELAALAAAASEAGIDSLIEAHDEAEVDAALAAGASIIGVNNRDLRDFSVDLGRAERLAARIPDGIVRVAESGIRTREDVARLEDAGYTAFLVGESLLRAPDPAARMQELFA